MAPITSSRSIRTFFGKAALLMGLGAALVACGGGGNSLTPATPDTPVIPPTPSSFSIAGNVGGLVGSGLVLQNNGGDNLAVSTNGNFTFASAMTAGAAYSVTVKTQPTTPAQTCTVANGSGTVSGAVTNVAVTCVTTPFFTLGGTISGLVGSGLVLQNNGADNLAVSANGSLTFATPLISGSAYNVTVKTQPYRQTCTVTNGSGTVSASVTNVTLACSTFVGQFTYVTNFGPGTVSGYTVDAATGGLVAMPSSPFYAGSGPVSVTIDPSGKFAYVANNSSSNVSAYTINGTTGALTAVAGSPYALGGVPRSVTIDPKGKFVYVPSGGTSGVFAYAIHTSSGALTPVAGSPFLAGSNTAQITVDPAGKFAYVVDASSNNVSAYAIDESTGALAPVAGSPYATGASPYSIVLDPAGKFAYVANRVGGNISAYTVNATTGALTAVAGSPYSSANPNSLAVDPTGKFLYAVNYTAPGQVFAFGINSSTGALSAVSGSPYATGGDFPTAVYVEPAGQFAYVVNNNTSNVSFYALNPTTGGLTLSGTINTGANPDSIAISK